MQIKKREAWIDCAKLIAMLAVLTDHMYGYAYSSLSIQFAALFAVSLFVLLSGISAGTAYKRQPDISFSSQFGRLKRCSSNTRWQSSLCRPSLTENFA